MEITSLLSHFVMPHNLYVLNIVIVSCFLENYFRAIVGCFLENYLCTIVSCFFKKILNARYTIQNHFQG
jgi:hypothetical protein